MGEKSTVQTPDMIATLLVLVVCVPPRARICVCVCVCKWPCITPTGGSGQTLQTNFIDLAHIGARLSSHVHSHECGNASRCISSCTTSRTLSPGQVWSGIYSFNLENPVPYINKEIRHDTVTRFSHALCYCFDFHVKCHSCCPACYRRFY